MIILLLSLMSESQIEKASDNLPAVIKLLDNPDFDTRESATEFLIHIGQEYKYHPESSKCIFLNFQVEQFLSKAYDNASLEGKYRINRITSEIR